MRSLWENLYRRLARSTNTLQCHQEYERIRQRRVSLALYPDPASLIDFFHDPDRNLDDKDIIYGDLIREVQEPQGATEAAARLLWIGLWPGLDATWHACTRLFEGEDQELVGAITYHFTRHIQRANLKAINRVAATLIMNTRRDVRGQRLRELDGESLTTNLPEDDRLPAHGSFQAEDGSEIRDWVRSVIGTDTALVLLVLLEGYNLKEAAMKLGITHIAARHKFSRAQARLREANPEIAR